jgi:hypothetical protein
MWPAFSTWLQYTKWCLQAERNFKVMTAVVRRASQVLLSRAWNQWNQLLRYEKQRKEQVIRYVVKQVLNGRTSAAFGAWVEKVKLLHKMGKMLLRIVKGKASAGFRAWKLWLESVRRIEIGRRCVQIAVRALNRVMLREVSKAWRSWVDCYQGVISIERRQKTLLTKFSNRFVHRQSFFYWRRWLQHVKWERLKREKVVDVSRKCIKLMQGKTLRGFVQWRVVTERCKIFEKFKNHFEDPRYLGAFFDTNPAILQSLLSIDRTTHFFQNDPDLLHRLLLANPHLKCPNCIDMDKLQHEFQLPNTWINLIKLASKASTVANLTLSSPSEAATIVQSKLPSPKHKQCENPRVLRAMVAEILYSKIDADMDVDTRGENRLSLIDFVPVHLRSRSKIIRTINEGYSMEETAGNILKAIVKASQHNSVTYIKDQDPLMTCFTRFCNLMFPPLGSEVLDWLLRMLKGTSPLLLGDAVDKKTLLLGQLRADKIGDVIIGVCSDLKCSKKLTESTEKKARSFIQSNAAMGHDSLPVDAFVELLVSLWDEQSEYCKSRRRKGACTVSPISGDHDLCSSLFMSFKYLTQQS